MKYIVTRAKDWTSMHEITTTYVVHDEGAPDYRDRVAHVWWTLRNRYGKPGGACTLCSTRLVAMSRSCKHVQTVKRFIKNRENKK